MVALQNFAPDGLVDVIDNLVVTTAIGVVWRVPIRQRIHDLALNPLVELCHIALWFFLFGHMFVPFGKLK
jgi:hypothetical protein